LIDFVNALGDSTTAATSNYGNIKGHTYATGNTTGRYDVGGLIGRLGSWGSVTNAYASVNVTADRNFGGLIGHFSPGVEVTNSHYNLAGVTITAYTPDSPSTRLALTDANGKLTIGGLYGPQYTTWFNGGTLDGLASAGANNATTYFGAADANGVYSINSVAKLKDYLGFADQSSLKFRLETDLDMAATPGVFVPYVAGTLDTNNRITINNLALRQYTSNQGFIGHLRNNTTQATANVAMNNLTVNGNITGTMNLGLVAGSDWQRNITNVTTTGSVTGQDTYYFMNPDHDDRGENNSGSGNSWSNVGGVVGYAWGRNTNRASNLQLTGISSSATVTGVNAVGGLAGHVQFGSITNSNTTGAVTSVAQTSINVYRTGGLVGYLNSTNSEISNSNHTVGLVKGYNYVGGLAGEAFGQLGVNVSANSTPTYNTFVSSNVEGNGGCSRGGRLG
jgi:hypothetical protein